MADISRFAPMPPDLTLASAHYEAAYFAIPLAGQLGELVFETSQRPDIQEAMAAYQTPEPIPLDPEGNTKRVFQLLAQDKHHLEIAKELGVADKTVRRHLQALYAQAGTLGEGDTTRRLIEQGHLRIQGGLGLELELTPVEHLLGILISRNWSIQHLTARSGQPGLANQKKSLSFKAKASSLAGITHRLFASRQLAP